MLVKDLIARRSRFAKSAWIHLIERSNVEGAAALHLTSALEGAELERFGWQLPRLAVIPNAIDEPLSQNGEIASDVETIISEQPLVLFFGRLSWKKGLDRLPSCIRLYPSWSTGHCRHRRREIQPPTCKACCRAADRRPSWHPAPHGYRSGKGAPVRRSTSLRAAFVLGKLSQYRARGDAAYR